MTQTKTDEDIRGRVMPFSVLVGQDAISTVTVTTTTTTTTTATTTTTTDRLRSRSHTESLTDETALESPKSHILTEQSW